jgi:xanthine dehydrogenase iron-sulfur cluster and FAD-binding subunit A
VLHKVQQAGLDHDVPQCGYCQSGMIMAVAALLREKPQPSDADIDSAITNICRCGTFQQVRAAPPARTSRATWYGAGNSRPETHSARSSRVERGVRLVHRCCPFVTVSNFVQTLSMDRRIFSWATDPKRIARCGTISRRGSLC